MSPSAHVDTFARDHLPPAHEWPDFLFELPELRYPERLNCAGALLDPWIAAGAGARPAIGSPREDLSYGELLERVCRIAAVLTEDLGLVPGNRVLLRGGNSPMMAACWLAIVRAGGIVVATMPLLRARELATIANKARTSIALCDRELDAELDAALPHCPDLARVLHFHDPSGLEARMSVKLPRFEPVPTAQDDVCLIAFTSGTTGVPKGTMHFHRDVMAVCDCFARHLLAPRPEDVFCGTPPLAFTFGLGGLLLFPLRFGGSTLLQEKLTPESLLAAIATRRATTLFTAPTFYRMMAPLAADADLASLRQCVSAGEALPASTRALWKDATGIDIIDGIGATEMLHIFISAAGKDIRPGATGRPIPGYEARVVDDDGVLLPPGTVGRLAVRGPTGCRYLADERQRQYVRHGWNLTGDAYLMDRDGYFHFQARADDMIVSAGYNIAGPEVEDVLLIHPQVAECAVTGVPDDTRGQIVKAWVVLRGGAAPSNELIKELQEWVRERLAPYKYPRAVEFVASLPRTETGKLQRFRLRIPNAAGSR